MKKMILGTVAIFIGSLFLVSCSSGDGALSSFSKRKYLKNFKEKKVKYEDKIEEVELASIKKVNYSDLLEEKDVQPIRPQVKNSKSVMLTKKEDKKAIKNTLKELKNWNKYNRVVTDNFLAYNNKAGEMHEAYNKVSVSSKQVDNVVLIILGIFLPPLAVYLYEDDITSNFWVDLLLTLLFWLPGIVFAMLVMFADVSV